MVLQGLSHKKSEARQIRFEIEGCEVIDYQKVGLRQKGGGSKYDVIVSAVRGCGVLVVKLDYSPIRIKGNPAE